MKKKVLLYLFTFVLALTTFLYFNTAYKEILRYNELRKRYHTVYNSFQNLSRQINIAAVGHTGLVEANKYAKNSFLFLADSQQVLQQLKLLKSTVQDSVNIKTVASLDKQIQPELGWIFKSNVPDPIINHQSPAHLASLQNINSLIGAGTQRSNYLLDDLDKKLSAAIAQLVNWMIVFMILSFILLLYTTLNLLLQKSKRKAKEKELEISNRLLKNAQRLGQMGNWQYDMAKDEQYWSDEMYNIWGIANENKPLSYTAFLATIHPDDRGAFNRALVDCLAGKTELNFEHKIILPDGSVKWVYEKGEVVNDENGKRVSFQGSVQDITVRKNDALHARVLAEITELFNEPAPLDEILQKVMEQLVAFSNFTIAEAWLVSKEQNIINLIAWVPQNEKLPAFYHKSADIRRYALGEGLPGIVWQTKMVQVWQKSKEDNGVIRSEVTQVKGLQTVYGLPIIYNLQVVGVFLLALDKGEQIAGNFLNLFKNLGIKSAIGIRRLQLEQDLNQIFTFAPDIICIAGIDGYFKKINPAASKLLGYTERELLSIPFENFIHPKDKTKTFSEVRSMNENAATSYFENRYITQSGKIKWLAWTSSKSATEGLFFAVAKDITDKKELEVLLNKANTLARIGNWEIDILKKIVYWSDMVKDIHETEPGYLPEMQTAIRFYKEGECRETIDKRLQEAIYLGLPWDEELLIVTARGNQRWVRTIGDPEFVHDKCVRIYGSLQDIDLRKRTQIELQKSLKALEDYRFALDQSGIISIANDLDQINYVNDNFCKISKYTSGELIGQTHKIVNSGYHPDQFFKDLWQTISAGKVWRGEIKNKAKDGGYYWVDTTIVPFLDNDNIPFQYLAIRFDITEKKLTEEKVDQAFLEKNTILESIGDAFFAVDKNWVVTYWNRIAEIFLHKTKNDVVGHHLWEVFPEGKESESFLKYHQAADSSQVVHFEDYYGQLDKWLEISAYPSDNGLSVYFQDITERKLSELLFRKLHENLQKQTKEISISNRELEQFAYVASHDLQEPLRMITGFVVKLKEKYADVFDESAKQYIDFAIDGAKRMRQIIMDLLEFSRVGSNEEKVELLDLNELVKEIQILYRKQIEEKNAIIRVDELPVIQAHKTPLRQVFQNLVSNALKYSRQDIPCEITISAEESTDHWQFAIADNGIGIDEKYFDRIFLIFQRLHTDAEYAGTGLGLAVTKKIIENEGGEIWLTSETGKGSVFYFTIPKK